MQTSTYDRRTIAFHWISAVLVLGLWGLGQCIDFFPKGDPRLNARSLHICFGAALAVVLLARLYWRATGATRLAPADPGVPGRLSIAVHGLLYVLLLLVVAAGLACAWFRGDQLFALWKIPAFDPGNRALAHNAVEFHGLMANILLGLAALHAGAALWHHFALKDDVLRRMWPQRTPGGPRH